MWIDGTALVAGLAWLPLVAPGSTHHGVEPARTRQAYGARARRGCRCHVLVLWLGRAYIVPRYLSYLLVPLFVLLATGMAEVFGRIRTRPAIVRTLASIVLLGLLAANFVVIAPDVTRLPREAYKDAAAIIERESPEAPVFAYVRNPEGLDYYLGRPRPPPPQPGEVAAAVCGGREAIAYVMQPFALEPVDVPCLGRDQVRDYRFEQYARGDEMNVWLVPPGS